jgi:hypothetical protein
MKDSPLVPLLFILLVLAPIVLHHLRVIGVVAP